MFDLVTSPCMDVKDHLAIDLKLPTRRTNISLVLVIFMKPLTNTNSTRECVLIHQGQNVATCNYEIHTKHRVTCLQHPHVHCNYYIEGFLHKIDLCGKC